MTKQISEFGISLTLPDGWAGEAFRETDEFVDSGPIVHVANTPVVLGDRDGYAGETRRSLRARDAVLCIVNLASLPGVLNAGGAERSAPDAGWSLRGASETPFNGVGNTQSSLRKAFRVGERVFDVIAFFGSPVPPSDVVQDLNAVLRTVRIDVSKRERVQRLEQYFSADAAVRINDERRAEVQRREAEADRRAGRAHAPERLT
jgi:hypothetical protein